MPTLVVVHKEFLMSQWVERIEEYLPGAKVGIAQQDQCDFEGKHIVVGMVHSLAKGRYPEAFYRHFGLVFVDECFPAGVAVSTPDGPRSIESLSVGDSVFSAAGEDVVEGRGSRLVPPSELRLVTTDNGDFICTKTTPFFL